MQNEKLNEQSCSKQSERNPGNTVGMNVAAPSEIGVVVKQTSHVALEGSHAPGNYVAGESADFSTAAHKTQLGPRGNSNNGA